MRYEAWRAMRKPIVAPRSTSAKLEPPRFVAASALPPTRAAGIAFRPIAGGCGWNPFLPRRSQSNPMRSSGDLLNPLDASGVGPLKFLRMVRR